MSFIRSLTALVFLTGFLFPQVHQAIHPFEHLHDTVCHAESEKHFHEQSEDCSLCDYQQPLNSQFCYFDIPGISIFYMISVMPVSDPLLPGGDDGTVANRGPPECGKWLPSVA